MITTPHFAAPFAFNARGESVVVEQDSTGDLEARAFNVAACPIGFREDKPDFGIPELLFQQVPLDIAAVQQEIARWASIDVSVSEAAEALDLATRRVLVEVS